jgi:hypothetical protein
MAEILLVDDERTIRDSLSRRQIYMLYMFYTAGLSFNSDGRESGLRYRCGSCSARFNRRSNGLEL